MTADPVLRKEKGELVMNKRLLAANSLVVCFPDTEQGRRLVRVFNQGLRQVDQEAIYRQHFNE
jgi:hypothetical protein